MSRLEALQALWDKLPKTVRVFVYLSVSALLAQLAKDLGVVSEGSVVARYLLIVINTALVLIPEAGKPVVNTVVSKLKK